MLTKVRRTMHKYNENFNRERENIGKVSTEITELKNIKIELKNSLEGFNSRLDKQKKE